jgi:hypothetical protein
VAKISEYQKTVPMSEIIREELRSSHESRPQTTYTYTGSVGSRRSQAASKAGSQAKPSDVEPVPISEPVRESYAPVKDPYSEPVAQSEESVSHEAEPVESEPLSLESTEIREAAEELVEDLEEEKGDE